MSAAAATTTTTTTATSKIRRLELGYRKSVSNVATVRA
jgi:hypothetical protein